MPDSLERILTQYGITDIAVPPEPAPPPQYGEVAKGTLGAWAVTNADRRVHNAFQARRLNQVGLEIFKNSPEYGDPAPTTSYVPHPHEKLLRTLAEEESNHQRYANTNQRNMRNELRAARAAIAAYDITQSSVLDTAFEGNNQLAPELRAQKPESMSWPEWLAQEPKAGTKFEDDHLLAVLRWHVAYVDRLNATPESAAWKADLRRQFGHKVQLAVARGSLPSPVLERSSKQLASVSINIGDAFCLAEQVAQGCYFRASHKIVLPEGAPETTQDHEATHAAIGWLDFGDSINNRYANEALTAHVGLALADGRFDVIEPDSHAEGQHMYPIERRLIGNWIRLSRGRLDIWDFIEAFVGGAAEEGALRQKVTRTLGFDALAQVAERVEIARAAAAGSSNAVRAQAVAENQVLLKIVQAQELALAKRSPRNARLTLKQQLRAGQRAG